MIDLISEWQALPFLGVVLLGLWLQHRQEIQALGIAETEELLDDD